MKKMLEHLNTWTLFSQTLSQFQEISLRNLLAVPCHEFWDVSGKMFQEDTQIFVPVARRFCRTISGYWPWRAINGLPSGSISPWMGSFKQLFLQLLGLNLHWLHCRDSVNTQIKASRVTEKTGQKYLMKYHNDWAFIAYFHYVQQDFRKKTYPKKIHGNDWYCEIHICCPWQPTQGSAVRSLLDSQQRRLTSLTGHTTGHGHIIRILRE